MSIRGRFNARKLDQWVTFQSSTETLDADAGTQTTVWTKKVDCWAGVDGLRASQQEPMASDALRSVSGLTVWIRSQVFVRTPIVLTDRMVWNGKRYDIKDIPDQQLRGRFIALFVTAGLNAG